MKRILFSIPFAAALLVGCTVHPAGEREERRSAMAAGKGYEPRLDQRQLPPLSPDSSPDELVKYALAASPAVEQAYWDWRAALEQVPIDGTEPTNLAVFGSVGISHGRTSLSQSTLSAGNDPMADIVLPNKLGAAARRSLALARAAGERFRKGRLDVEAKVRSAYEDYALTAELTRLDAQDVLLQQTISASTSARNEAGGAGQSDVLQSASDLDVARSELTTLQTQLSSRRATLNAALGRDADAPLAVPAILPASPPLEQSDASVLQAIGRSNPELHALADERRGREISIAVARLMYEPDLSITAGADLQGVAQTVSSMLTVPLLKYEAINASVAQAEANLRAVDALRRQTASDLFAEVVIDLQIIRDADRQLQLYHQTLLPRARQVAALSEANYESGGGMLADLLGSRRSVIAMQKLIVNLQAMRDKQWIDLASLRQAGGGGA